MKPNWYPLQDEVTVTLTKGNWRTIHSCLQSFAGISVNHGQDATYVDDLAEKLATQVGE